MVFNAVGNGMVDRRKRGNIKKIHSVCGILRVVLFDVFFKINYPYFKKR